MGKPRIFTTAPSRVIADTGLTALELRVLLVVALHDGMSGVTGKGGGCYARHSNLAKLCCTDATRFSKAVSRLIKLGYLVREPQLMDKRRYTLRVAYDADDSWRAGLLSDQEKVDAPAQVDDELVNNEGEIVGEHDSQNGGFSRETDEHYISLNEELDFDKSKELNSLERAHLLDARDNQSDPFSVDSFSSEHRFQDEKDTAEAGLGRKLTLAQHLPRNFGSLPLGAQVSHLDQAFTRTGRDAGALDNRERELFLEWLDSVFDDYAGGELDAIAQQAGRLRDDLHVW